MNDYSIGEKMSILLDVISSSPLFFACTLIGLLAIIFFIITIINNKKTNKYVLLLFLSFMISILLILYNSTVVKIFDSLFEEIFMALYFPSITVYVTTLLISNVFLIYSIFNSELRKSLRIGCMVNAFTLDTFLILIIGLVTSKNIDVYEVLTVYSDPGLLVLLELSMAIFTSWILISLLITASVKVKKYDLKQNLPDIVFDE